MPEDLGRWLDQEHKQHERGSSEYNVVVQGRQASKSTENNNKKLYQQKHTHYEQLIAERRN